MKFDMQGKKNIFKFLLFYILLVVQYRIIFNPKHFYTNKVF